jgi:hypothetical protein
MAASNNKTDGVADKNTSMGVVAAMMVDKNTPMGKFGANVSNIAAKNANDSEEEIQDTAPGATTEQA